MGSFSFNCPNCNNSLVAQDEWRGQRTQCPSCSTTIMVPITIDQVDAPPALDERKCPKCGKNIKKEAVFCRWCKQNIAPLNASSSVMSCLKM